MKNTPIVKKILSNYENDNSGTLTNLSRILNAGKLGGTGKMIILPVDQGFEHGPDRSFAENDLAYDPKYHFELAVEAGLNAFAAPLGMLEAGARSYAGEIPLILKLNSSNSLTEIKDQSVNASIEDALKLGCVAVGFTIYPGSEYSYKMMEEIAQLSREAKAKGLAVVIWSYARGGKVSKDGETAIDVISYAAHIACLLGANIVKVKLQTDVIDQPENKKVYEKTKIDVSSLEKRVAHVVKSCFAGRRIVVFSGGASKDESSLLDEAKAIKVGGGNGSIIGRNSFQRPKAQALKLLDDMIKVYKS